MKKNHFFMGLMAAMAMTSVFSSCSNDEVEGVNNQQPKQLTLKSQSITTRSTSQTLQATQIASGVKVGAYVTSTGTTTATSTGSNVELTADGSGNFTGGSMIWPTSGNIDIYAYAPYNSSASLSEALSFSVSADQSSEDNYLASDLLYASATNQTETTDGTVALTFAHKLTKLNINITNNNTEIDLTDATVTVQNTLPTTALTLTDGTLAAASGDATDIKAATFATDATEFKAAAVIVPQTIASGTTLVKIEPATGNPLIVKLGSEVAFVAGKSYTYTVTINAATVVETTLTLTSAQVTDWTDGDALSGYYTKGLTSDQQSAFIANMSGSSSLTSITGQGNNATISAWHLPSMGQMRQILNQFGSAGLTTSSVNDSSISSTAVCIPTQIYPPSSLISSLPSVHRLDIQPTS